MSQTMWTVSIQRSDHGWSSYSVMASDKTGALLAAMAKHGAAHKTILVGSVPDVGPQSRYLVRYGNPDDSKVARIWAGSVHQAERRVRRMAEFQEPIHDVIEIG